MIHRAAQINQSVLVVDVMDLAMLIEDEFHQVLEPYPAGWYRRADELPVMPMYAPGTTQPIYYHVKGGVEDAPWGEKITTITDPNTANSNIYDNNGDLIFDIRFIGTVKKTNPYADKRTYFSPHPSLPWRGYQIVMEYVTWLVDRASEHSVMDMPFQNYIRKYVREDQLEAAEVLTIEPYEMNEETARAIRKAGSRKLTIASVCDELVPHVNHTNTLVEKIQETLDFQALELRRLLDSFIGINTWEVVGVSRYTTFSLFIQKKGDFRILEWQRLKQEGKI